MSGNAMCDQFHQSDPQAAAAELGSALGCTSKKGEDIVECVKRFRQQEIVRASKEMTVSTEKPGNVEMLFLKQSSASAEAS